MIFMYTQLGYKCYDYITTQSEVSVSMPMCAPHPLEMCKAIFFKRPQSGVYIYFSIVYIHDYL